MKMLMVTLLASAFLTAGCTSRECEVCAQRDPSVVATIEARGYGENVEEADLNALRSAKVKMEEMGYAGYRMRVNRRGGGKFWGESSAQVHAYYDIIRPPAQQDHAAVPTKAEP